MATVLLPFGLGYYLSYLYRTVNVVIAKPLAADLALSAADLGLLTSIYFIVFAAFQTPLGVLLDRYGPRRVQATLLIFAATGSALFAVSSNFLLLAIGRGLIGFGVCGCLMAALKANVLWFPRERLPLVNGCTVAFGSFGALSGTVPVEFLFGLFGWRPIFALLATVTVAVIIMTYLLVPERDGTAAVPRPGARGGLRGQLHDLRLIYTSPHFWRVCLPSFLHTAVYLSYQSLWMGPWLRDVAGLSLPSVAQTLLLFNIGMFIGVLGIGALTDRLQAFGIRPIVIMGGGLGASLVIQTMFALEQTAFAAPLCFAFGFFGSSTLLIYSVLGQDFPARLAGRANTAQNMLTFIGAFGVQWGAGVIINLWPERPGGLYDPAGHQAAFLTVIGLELLTFLWFLLPRRSGAGIPQ